MTKAEHLFAVTALFASLSALGVYIYQAKVMREQQHVSVWPYMEWSTSNVEDYHITAQNKGVGPALIRKVEMRLDGKPVANNQALVQALMGPGRDLYFINSNLEGRVLTPGEKVEPLRVPDAKTGRDVEARLGAHHFQMRITYASIYGECWETDGSRVRRLPNVEVGLY